MELRIIIYLYVFKADFYYNKNNIEYTDAVLLPVALKIEINNDNLKILKHKFPEDGKNHGKSMRKIFPSDILEQNLKLNSLIKDSSGLIETAYKRAAKFYNNS